MRVRLLYPPTRDEVGAALRPRIAASGLPLSMGHEERQAAQQAAREEFADLFARWKALSFADRYREA